MLIQPWDAARDPDEWRRWFASTDRFGVIAVPNQHPGRAPLLVPTHMTLHGHTLLTHLARPNPAWPHLEEASEVRVAVTDDHAYIPSTWRARDTEPPAHGVPTTYYASVQLLCRPATIDDREGKADILNAQLADRQPDGDHATVAADTGPHHKMLSAIRGLRLEILHVDAKFKYDDHRPAEQQQRIAAQLEARGLGRDVAAAAQQRRRLDGQEVDR